MVTLYRFHACGAWHTVEEDLVNFVRQCLYCVDFRLGHTGSCPLGEPLHSLEIEEILHFDYVSLRASDLLGPGDVIKRDCYYVQVIMGGVVRFIWLELTVSFTSEVASRTMMMWRTVRANASFRE